ncbi:MAG: endonuclease domain-containing protein [SAR202 cluster bacterium]|nr:endonuclease domain-containing protein [SAR202 cluster bacterium]
MEFLVLGDLVRQQPEKNAEWRTAPSLWDKLRPVALGMRSASTAAEDALWQRLRNRRLDGLRFRRQHSIDRFIVDFYSPEAKLVLEIDGPIHDTQQEQDEIRQDILESLGFTILRFTNEDVLENIDAVLKKISEAAQDLLSEKP